jgi:chromate transporter
MNQNNNNVSEPVSLWFLGWTFLKIGSVAFGGFMALITVVQNTIVERHKLLDSEEILDGISLATLLPGPVAVNVVSYIGYRLRGGMGAFVCATAVILPSFFLLLALTIAYLEWGELPVVEKILAGVIPAVGALIINAAWGMRGKALKGTIEKVMALIAATLLLIVGGFYLTLGLVLLSGFAGYFLFLDKQSTSNKNIFIAPLALNEKIVWGISVLMLLACLVLFLINSPTLVSDLNSKLFVTFSGMSLMLFGGGFVFIPLIQEVVVDGYHWVNQMEFTTAIALGQVTPGPILISATFIGYKVNGVVGAFIATFSIFFPPALLMITISKALDYVKQSPAIQAIMQGVRAVVVGLIFAAGLVVMQTAPISWVSGVIFMATLVALIKYKVDVVWIIPTTGLFSYAYSDYATVLVLQGFL